MYNTQKTARRDDCLVCLNTFLLLSIFFHIFCVYWTLYRLFDVDNNMFGRKYCEIIGSSWWLKVYYILMEGEHKRREKRRWWWWRCRWSKTIEKSLHWPVGCIRSFIRVCLILLRNSSPLHLDVRWDLRIFMCIFFSSAACAAHRKSRMRRRSLGRFHENTSDM